MRAGPEANEARDMAARKEDSGDALFRKAEKCVRPNVLKLKFAPDWMEACTLYEKAAVAYRRSDQHEKAKLAYERAALGQERIGSKWHAAKLIESACVEAKKAGQSPDDVVACVRSAATLYREAGREQTSADALVRGAKLVEDMDDERAFQMIQEAIQTYEDEDRYAQVTDLYREGLNLLIRHKRYEDAAVLLMRWGQACGYVDAKHTQNKVYMNAVILWLFLEDVVQANNTYLECLQIDGFESSDEAYAVSEILDAYRSGDPELIKKCTQTNRTFSHTDNCVARLVRQLPLGDVNNLATQLENACSLGGPDDVLDEDDLT